METRKSLVESDYSYFVCDTMNIINMNASGLFIRTREGYQQVPKNCECAGVFRFSKDYSIICDKCGLVFQ